MIFLRLGHLLSLLIALPILHALPFLPKPSRLFGVDVPPEIRHGREGSRLIRGYQLRLLPFSAGILLLACWSPPAWLWADLLPAFAALWLHHRYHAAAIRFALPPSSIREASLASHTDGLARRMLWFAPPLVLIAITALLVFLNWNRIPETYPIHFDLNGSPSGWAHRTVRAVFGFLIFAAYFIVFLIAIYLPMDLGSRRATRRPVMLAVLAAPCYFIAIMACLVAMLPFFSPPPWVFLILIGGFFAIYIWLLAGVLSQPAEGPPEITPDDCWHGAFYYNPDDPALFVESRTAGFGYTANLAQPLSWLVMAITLALATGIFLVGRNVFG
jgi:uncharacterized membrane protein